MEESNNQQFLRVLFNGSIPKILGAAPENMQMDEAGLSFTLPANSLVEANSAGEHLGTLLDSLNQVFGAEQRGYEFTHQFTDGQFIVTAEKKRLPDEAEEAFAARPAHLPGQDIMELMAFAGIFMQDMVRAHPPALQEAEEQEPVPPGKAGFALMFNILYPESVVVSNEQNQLVVLSQNLNTGSRELIAEAVALYNRQHADEGRQITMESEQNYVQLTGQGLNGDEMLAALTNIVKTTALEAAQHLTNPVSRELAEATLLQPYRHDLADALAAIGAGDITVEDNSIRFPFRSGQNVNAVRAVLGEYNTTIGAVGHHQVSIIDRPGDKGKLATVNVSGAEIEQVRAALFSEHEHRRASQAPAQGQAQSQPDNRVGGGGGPEDVVNPNPQQQRLF